ncbi:MAG TPA: DegT/DnrJ/EryC1/StrS family aminotransferase, partial [Thermoanaerobaculia bacterium]
MNPKNPVPILDLTRYDEDLKREIASSVAEVFQSGRFILGPFNARFEKAFAERIGVKHALGVSSGTDALLVSLMALGVKPGDEVVTTPFSFFASAGVVSLLGARPVFADIVPASFNMDPNRLAAAITPRTKAVLPIHLYGQCADIDPILEVAGAIPVVEDACQAVGATYRGRAAGALGTIAAFSFYPTKNLGGAGDAG